MLKPVLAAASLILPASALAASLGLFPSSDFEVKPGREARGQAPLEALWYFPGESVAVLRAGAERHAAHPPLAWIGSPLLEKGLTVDFEGRTLTRPDGTRAPLSLVEKLPSNAHFFDRSSAEFFRGRGVRARGRETAAGFEARVLWPEDYLLAFREESLRLSPPAEGGEALEREIADMIESGPQGAADKFAVRLLWERPGAARDWGGKPVLGLMLNGAQGDDDEALGGHFGAVTGVMGPDGEWADWLVTNFYSVDVESEKGIVAAQLPMDAYLMDLNSGQNWYRPSYLAVVVLDGPDAAMGLQAALTETMNRFYRHELVYEHAKLNCTGLSLDAMRALGWNVPAWGSSGALKAIFAYFFVSLTDKEGVKAGKKAFDYIMEERTRLLPRAGFEAAFKDALDLARGSAEKPGRALTDFERMLAADARAILFVRIPQIPSSREFGRDPLRSVEDFQKRVPDRERMKKRPESPKRPYPPPGAAEFPAEPPKPVGLTLRPVS